MGDITELELETGLAAKQVTGERLGEVLVKKAFIARPALRIALGIQLTIPTISPDPGLISKGLLQNVNTNFLYQRKVVPVSYNKEEDILTVIMDDPLDVETIADLEKIFKSRIEPAILTHGDIKHLLDVLFDPWARLLESAGAAERRGPRFAGMSQDTPTIKFM